MAGNDSARTRPSYGPALLASLFVAAALAGIAWADAWGLFCPTVSGIVEKIEHAQTMVENPPPFGYSSWDQAVASGYLDGSALFVKKRWTAEDNPPGYATIKTSGGLRLQCLNPRVNLRVGDAATARYRENGAWVIEDFSRK
jgi:hypothetical protein